MNNKLFCFILILILILGSFAFVFADSDFYYPMIPYVPNNGVYFGISNATNDVSSASSYNYPVYIFYVVNDSLYQPIFLSNYQDAKFKIDLNNSSTDRFMTRNYNNVYYYNPLGLYYDINNDFPVYSSLEQGLVAFDNYFQEQGTTNDTIFNLGVFVSACLQFVAATASFIMQYPILMIFILLPVISYIVILLRRLLLLGR